MEAGLPDTVERSFSHSPVKGGGQLLQRPHKQLQRCLPPQHICTDRMHNRKPVKTSMSAILQGQWHLSILTEETELSTYVQSERTSVSMYVCCLIRPMLPQQFC